MLVRCLGNLVSPSYEERLHILHLQSLQTQRLIAGLILFYKIVDGTVKLTLPSDVRPLNLKTRGHNMRFHVDSAKSS